jgi:hypothetical protein
MSHTGWLKRNDENANVFRKAENDSIIGNEPRIRGPFAASGQLVFSYLTEPTIPPVVIKQL